MCPALLQGAGRLVINEIMINEPGSETSLEWVELFNAGDDSLDLKDHIFIEASDTTRFAAHWLQSREFAILSRKPITTDGAASFERQWGSASNVWGDDSLENFVLLPAKMSLRNSNDSATIVDLSSGRIETVKWSIPPPDGVSLERVNPTTDALAKNFKYCKSAAMSTPGRANSVVAKMHDWGFIEDDCEIFVPPGPDLPLEFGLVVANFGQLQSPSMNCSLIFDRDFDGAPSDPDSILEFTIEALSPDSSEIFTPTLSLSAGRQSFIFQLPEDDDISNNSIHFECVIGPIAAELLISEFVNNASDSIGCEWIEVQSIVPYNLSLQGWSLEIDGRAISLDSQEFVESGETIVLCKDSVCFRSGNSGIACRLIQPAQWHSLGNEQSAIALRMHLGALSDSVGYRGAIESGRSWERDFDSTSVDFESLFYRSTSISGSTPCNRNSPRPAPIAFDIGIVPGSLILTKDSLNNSIVRAELQLANHGYNNSGSIAIQVFDDSNRDGVPASSELILTHDIDPILKGDSVTVAIAFAAATGRKIYIFTLDDDEILSNNAISGVITAGSLTRELIITEILADPVGSLETEWIEIKNASGYSVDLHGWQIGDAAHQSVLDHSVLLAPDEYCVVAQDAGAFTRYYGAACEPLACRTWSYLNNGGDCIIVRDEFGTISDSVTFGKGAGDNRSLEKNEQDVPGLPMWNPSIDPLGATPCLRNSIYPAPAAHDAGFVEGGVVITRDSSDVELLHFIAKIANLGYSALKSVSIEVFNDGDHDNIPSDNEFLARFDADSIGAGDTTEVDFSLQITAGRHVLILRLPEDELGDNNYYTAEISSGILLREIIITEFLADPEGSLETEWIEIKSISEFSIDLTGWSCGDLATQRIFGATRPIGPGEYAVVVQDATAFAAFYGEGCHLISATTWSSLNNNGDAIILRDEFGTISDSVSYSNCAGENLSLERNESEPVASSNWYPSTSSSGATPCAANSVSGNYSGEVSFSLINRVFAPSAGENLQFALHCPPASKFTIEVFDLVGRRQRVIADDDYFSSGEFSYDGLSDFYSHLPIGAYIIKVESADGSFLQKAGFAVAPPK